MNNIIEQLAKIIYEIRLIEAECGRCGFTDSKSHPYLLSINMDDAFAIQQLADIVFKKHICFIEEYHVNSIRKIYRFILDQYPHAKNWENEINNMWIIELTRREFEKQNNQDSLSE